MLFRSKGILAIFSSLQPKSFKNNTPVILDNSQMSQSNSKNYHHFFPRAFLERKNIPNYNVISNITLISASDNQKDIRDKAPSKYMSEFEKNNPKLQKTMKNHLIHDLNDFGILNDDYQKFIAKRTKLIFDEIKNRAG